MTSPRDGTTPGDPTRSREPSDAELVARCLESKEAFAALYHRHAGALYALLRTLFRGDEHAAQDALQETFLRAYHALPRFDTSRPMRPWLLRIATNVGLDGLARARVRRAGEAGDAGAAADVAEAAERGAGPAEQAAAADACTSVIRRVAGRLAPRKLAAFLLARGQGLTYEEVASIQGCSTATVKRDLAEAVQVMAGAAEELGLA